MVNSPVDAIATFLQSGLDYLYMDQFEVARPKESGFLEYLENSEGFPKWSVQKLLLW